MAAGKSGCHTEKGDNMTKKSAWDRFFDDTEDIQCINCLDAYVLEYFIDDCRVRVDRISPGKYSVSVNKENLSKTWKKKNIYDQAIYKKFVSGYFFHQNEKVKIEFTQEELQLLYAACMSYGDKLSEIIKSIPNEETDRLSDRAKDSWNLARKITEYME